MGGLIIRPHYEKSAYPIINSLPVWKCLPRCPRCCKAFTRRITTTPPAWICLHCNVSIPHLVYPIINSLPLWKSLLFRNTVLCRWTPCARRIKLLPSVNFSPLQCNYTTSCRPHTLFLYENVSPFQTPLFLPLYMVYKAYCTSMSNGFQKYSMANVTQCLKWP